MTARKTCHYYKKTKCGSTTDNNEPIVVLPDHCDPKSIIPFKNSAISWPVK